MNFSNSPSASRRTARDLLDVAHGRWPHLLVSIGGLRDDQLTNAHQPCPSCGGDDRYRWLTDEGPGGWWCSHCGGKNRQGGAGSGIDLLMRVRDWTFGQAIREIERYHHGLPFTPAPCHTPMPKHSALNNKHSELQRFWLLELAGQLADGEYFSPSCARDRGYSKRWTIYASANYDAACSIVMEFDVTAGIQAPPVQEDPQTWEEYVGAR